MMLVEEATATPKMAAACLCCRAGGRPVVFFEGPVDKF